MLLHNVQFIKRKHQREKGNLMKQNYVGLANGKIFCPSALTGPSKRKFNTTVAIALYLGLTWMQESLKQLTIFEQQLLYKQMAPMSISFRVAKVAVFTPNWVHVWCL